MAKLTDLVVQWISLVKRPANGRGVVLKARDSRGREIRLKADAKLRRLYGIVYAPDEVDAQGDFADAETIRKAADRWMLEGRAQHVDREHGFQPVPAFVAESWIVRTGDALFPTEREGAWAVGIQIEDAALWDAIEAGEVEGISLAGTVRVERKGMLARLFGPKKEDEMNADEVRAIVREVLAETVREAEAHETAERVAKSLAEKEAELAALRKAIAERDELLAGLARRIEALEQASPKGDPEGDAGKAPEASFV